MEATGMDVEGVELAMAVAVAEDMKTRSAARELASGRAFMQAASFKALPHAPPGHMTERRRTINSRSQIHLL